MTDYYPLIARAVEGLDRSTGEARRALYERARDALVAQLRSNQPALFEADITKERLALEEAIRKVEAEAARKSRNESQAEQRASRAQLPRGRARLRRFRRFAALPRRRGGTVSIRPRPICRAPGWTVPPSARERLLSGRSSLKKRGVKGFRDVVGEVTILARQPPRRRKPRAKLAKPMSRRRRQYRARKNLPHLRIGSSRSSTPRT